MRDMVSGEDNLAIGIQAMLRSTTASFNMAFGSGALENNDAGVNNVGSPQTGVGRLSPIDGAVKPRRVA